MMSSLADTALIYATKRKNIFPVARDKKPLVAWKEFQERIPTSQEVKEWWTKWPDANIGMATGHLSGWTVIDGDTAEAVNRFQETYPEARQTLQVQTGRDGARHFVFIHEPGIINDAGKLLGSGIDVRGEGGYVVIPPSIHANGKSYRWLNKNKPVALPDKLREILVSRSKDGDQPNGEGQLERFNTPLALDGVLEGQRDGTLFSLACKLRNADVPQDWAEKLVSEAARNCQPPFPESIALEKVARAYQQYLPGATPSDSFPHYREETVRKEIKLQTWEEFLSSTPEQREYTINGILPDSGLAVLLGRGKHGKSTLAVHACRAIGTGWDFLERQTKIKPIVYVNYEMAEDYLHTLLGAGDCPKGAFIINRPETILSLKTIGGLMDQVGGWPWGDGY